MAVGAGVGVLVSDSGVCETRDRSVSFTPCQNTTPTIVSSIATAATSHLTENGRDFSRGRGGGANVGARTGAAWGAKEASPAKSSTKALAFL